MEHTPEKHDWVMPELALKRWFFRIPLQFRIAFFSTIVFSLLIHFPRM